MLGLGKRKGKFPSSYRLRNLEQVWGRAPLGSQNEIPRLPGVAQERVSKAFFVARTVTRPGVLDGHFKGVETLFGLSYLPDF